MIGAILTIATLVTVGMIALAIGTFANAMINHDNTDERN